MQELSATLKKEARDVGGCPELRKGESYEKHFYLTNTILLV